MAAEYICIYPTGYTLTGAEQAKFDVSHRYTSMSAMEAGEDINWVSITSNPVIIILGGDVNNNWGTAGKDTSAVLLSGWTLSVIYPFFLTAEGTARSEDAWDTNAYIISVDGDEAIHVSSASFVGQWEGFQIESTGTSSELIFFVRWITTCEIKNCWFHDATGLGTELYQYVLSPPQVTRIWNCVFDGTPAQCCTNRVNSSWIYHNTMTTSTNYCLRAYTGTSQYVENNILFNNADDWRDDGWTTRNYNASDDAEGDNPIDMNENAGGEWTNSFVAYLTGNYKIKDTDAIIYGAGRDLTNLFTDTLGNPNPLGLDKIGNPRAGIWSVGAFEYAAVGAGAIMNQLQKNNLGADLYNGSLI